MHSKGYVPGVDGNTSMRLDEKSFLITPSGVSKEVVKPRELVRISMSGDVMDEGKRPSIETNMHLAAFNHSDANAVIHVHSSNAVAFALARVNIDTRYTPAAYYHLGLVGYVPYYASGSELLHSEVTALIKKKYKVVLLESHGALVMGADMQDAFAKTDLLETYAGMLMKADSLGGAVRLTDEQLDEIHGG